MTTATQWIRKEILQLAAYPVQDATGMIKLDAMENPYSWPDTLRDAWGDSLKQAAVNRYPDPQAIELSNALRSAMQIPAEMRLLLGNGSDEIIQMMVMALGSGQTLLSIEPSFSMYRIIAASCGLNYVGVPLSQTDFSLDLPALLQAIEHHQPAITFLAYPNNPTGNLFKPEEVHAVIQASPGLVVLDEAYAPFTDASFTNILGQYANLVVMRTVSKMGLAGLRLGLLAGPADWLDAFNKVRLPYNINVLTQISVHFALQHQTAFDQQAQKIRAERARLLQALSALPGCTIFPSEANFILFKTPQGQANTFFSHLKKRGVLIKNLDGAHPLLKDCLRPTVGTPAENAAMLAALNEVAAN